jgi:hypothetical protein
MIRFDRSFIQDKDKPVLDQVEGKISEIQAEIDEVGEDLKAVLVVADRFRDKLRVLRPKLVPYNKLKTGLCSKRSKQKYFPGFRGDFSEFAASELVKLDKDK